MSEAETQPQNAANEKREGKDYLGRAHSRSSVIITAREIRLA